MEELEEAEVLWPEDSQLRPSSNSKAQVYRDSDWNSSQQTAAMNIPQVRSAKSNGAWISGVSKGEEDGSNGGSSGRKTIVPPHLLVARRFSEKMASSVCSGQGRTLKGRDLRQFRDSILRLTGFLER